MKWILSIAVFIFPLNLFAARAVMEGIAATDNTVYVDTTNVRIGINDITPSYGLDVNGTGRYTGAVTMDNSLDVTDAITTSSDVVANAYYGDGSTLTEVGKYVFVSSYTVGASSATSITFSGLTMQNNQRYEFLLSLKGGASCDVDLFANGETSRTGYETERFYGYGSSVGAWYGGQALFIGYGVNSQTFHGGYGTAQCIPTGIDGNCVYQFNSSAGGDRSDNGWRILTTAWRTASVSDVTSLVFYGSSANCFGTGSQISLYEISN